MIRRDVIAGVAVCRAVIGEGSIAVQDALAAAEAWAGGEYARIDEYCLHEFRCRGTDERGEAVSWILAAAYDRDETESAWCLEQCLMALAAIPGWDESAIRELHHDKASPRDTIPTPAPALEAA